jgi:ribose-phosphate pyrophosphokinase
MAANLIARHLRQTLDLSDAVLVASDAGEAKDIGRYANRLHLPIAVIDKRRHADDEKAVAENLIGDVRGKTALITDDEIATGGTLVESARFVLSRGAKRVVAAATHPVFSRDPRKLAEAGIHPLVVTDTLPVPADKRPEGLEILSVAPLLADAIRCIHDGTSVSRLFMDD